MSEYKIYMPKLGESVQEATITRWFVKEGDLVEEDTPLFEIATDKVDSEIPSPVAGKIKKVLFDVNALIPVGEVVVLIELNDEEEAATEPIDLTAKVDSSTDTVPEIGIEESIPNKTSVSIKEVNSLSNRFYSPLVKSIAEKENLSIEELENIPGSGLNGRVQKKDVFDYLSKREIGKSKIQAEEAVSIDKADRELTSKVGSVEKNKIPMSIGVEDTIMEMDRVRKLIADHMVNSKHTAPHVTAMVEADVTNMVLWRNRAKDIFTSRYGEKLTYMPLFIEAVAKALNEFPLVNTSVDVDKIILRKHRNIGIAVAKPDGNLVVPVLKDADEKNLLGITRELNRLAEGARLNKLSPDAYQDGTFTITNFGSFKNLFGTPIINQPQVAILATGSIEKKPAVMETPTGDVIVVRHKMFLSLSYDHRIVDGALGGAFLRRIADLLEGFDVNHEI